MTYYAKLNGQILDYAPEPFILNEEIIENPTAEQYAELGYLPVNFTESPDVNVYQYAEEYWIQTDTEIKRIWNIKDIPINEHLELLIQQLSLTDYKAIKHSEGLISDEDYMPIKQQRQNLRDEINKLQEKI